MQPHRPAAPPYFAVKAITAARPAPAATSRPANAHAVPRPAMVAATPSNAANAHATPRPAVVAATPSGAALRPSFAVLDLSPRKSRTPEPPATPPSPPAPSSTPTPPPAQPQPTPTFLRALVELAACDEIDQLIDAAYAILDRELHVRGAIELWSADDKRITRGHVDQPAHTTWIGVRYTLGAIHAVIPTTSPVPLSELPHTGATRPAAPVVRSPSTTPPTTRARGTEPPPTPPSNARGTEPTPVPATNARGTEAPVNGTGATPPPVASDRIAPSPRAEIELLALQLGPLAERLLDREASQRRSLKDDIKLLYERRIRDALIRHDGNVSAVARELRIGRTRVSAVARRWRSRSEQLLQPRASVVIANHNSEQKAAGTQESVSRSSARTL